jgi:26S proteasome regulatory subunit N5
MCCMCSALLDLFLTNEIMNWRDFVSKYEAELRGSSPGANIFNSKTEDGNKRWTDLKNRVVEHVSGIFSCSKVKKC